MWVLIALLPSAGFGIYNFGVDALIILLLSVASCVLSEFIYEKALKKPVTIGDLSAVVTGLLLGMNLPSTVPWWIPILGGIFAIPTMIGYIRYRGGKLTDCKEWDKLLYWYVHSFLWGRYAGSTESTLSQDLNMINQNGGIDGLIKARDNAVEFDLKTLESEGCSEMNAMFEYFDQLK